MTELLPARMVAQAVLLDIPAAPKVVGHGLAVPVHLYAELPVVALGHDVVVGLGQRIAG